MHKVAYKSGYKYQLETNYDITVPIRPSIAIDTRFIMLNKNGRLLIKKFYAWDGPSGPSIDTKNFMRGSLVHDALYQLMREGHLSPVAYRGIADRILKDICLQDGMSSIRAWWVHQAVANFAGSAADSSNVKKTIYAP